LSIRDEEDSSRKLMQAKKKDLGPVDRGHPESESCRAAGSALRVYLKSASNDREQFTSAGESTGGKRIVLNLSNLRLDRPLLIDIGKKESYEEPLQRMTCTVDSI
jgi:hypothetical protein